MRVLILGSSGFVGASAAREIEKSQEVIRAYRGAVNAGEYDVDLGQRESVRRTLEKYSLMR